MVNREFHREKKRMLLMKLKHVETTFGRTFHFTKKLRTRKESKFHPKFRSDRSIVSDDVIFISLVFNLQVRRFG